MNNLIIYVSVMTAFLVTGCSMHHTSLNEYSTENSAAEINRHYETGDIFAFTFTETESNTGKASDELSLPDALDLALRQNPQLAVSATEIRSRDAAALQAGLLENPELEVEVENFGGDDELEGFDSSEMKIALSQLIELGGKRGRRRNVALLEKKLAEWDLETEKLDLISDTAILFVHVLAAQELVALNDELVRIAEQSAKAVQERVDAGKIAPVEKYRAQVELSAARSKAHRARRDLEAARSRLAASWGSDSARFLKVTGDLTEMTSLPDTENLEDLLNSNPDLARWNTEIDKSKAGLKLARSEAIPDLTVSAGVTASRESDNHSFSVGLSIPLPLFNRNQGGVREALANLDKTREKFQSENIALKTKLTEAINNLEAARSEAVILRDEILPSAKEAYKLTELGYSRRSMDFLQMLDAQRTLFNVRREYLEALETYHLANIEMARIIGIFSQERNDITHDSKE